MKYQANQQTKESIFIDVLDDNNTILNSVEVGKYMDINSFYTLKWGLSHAIDQSIINFIKDATGFKFNSLTASLKVIKKTKRGIYFLIHGVLHFYLKRENFFVLCRETGPGKYYYNFGNNYNKPQQTEIINKIKQQL